MLKEKYFRFKKKQFSKMSIFTHNHQPVQAITKQTLHLIIPHPLFWLYFAEITGSNWASVHFGLVKKVWQTTKIFLNHTCIV